MKKLIALVFALVASSVFAAEFPDISIADLKQAIADKKVTVIDVNGAASYAKGHVPGAVDFASKGADLASVLPADKGALVVAYCGGPSVQRLQGRRQEGC
jgi:rhodanese-related sulfurtransferase